MENLAYLHLAFAHEEDETDSELLWANSLLSKTVAPDWRRFSNKAWRYMLPLALTLSLLSVATSAFALERGDQGPSVRNLQQQLKQAGFLKAPITQVFDAPTEEAVKRFQKKVGLEMDGVVGPVTQQKLSDWGQQTATINSTNNQTENEVTNTVNNQTENEVTNTANNTGTNTTNNQSQPKKPVANKKTVPETVVATMSTPLSTPKATQTQTTGTLATATVAKPANTTTNTSTVAIPPTKRRNPNLLGKGDEGMEVKELQERLRVAGFYFGNATGLFGPITEEAVKRFQTAYNLDADGIVGQATLAKLPPSGVGFGEEQAKVPTEKEMLSLGDRGEAVRVLQQHLIKAGYLKGEPTGYYGPVTGDAVKRFQASNYLQPTGIAGPTTRGKIYAAVNTTAESEFSILEIQRRLSQGGFYKGPINGVMNDETKRAIKLAQEHFGVSSNDIKGGRQ
jgi:peptidoglycan hydrolase-like protein with peptidoglycan-binding domain